MPYSYKKYPNQLDNLKPEARKKWIDVFNAVYADSKDEDDARKAAWHIVTQKWSNKNYMIKENLRFKDLFLNNNIQNEETIIKFQTDWSNQLNKKYKKVKYERVNTRDIIARVNNKQVGFWDDDDQEGIIQ